MNLGVICEFNPFHKGHKYLIDSVKKEGDRIICVMSGNFVQRGEPAVFDKFKRAETALENGADIVIELPSVYSTLSAQGFAGAGVGLLEATGICEAIAFGAECGSTDELLRISNEIKEKDEEIKDALKSGISYPAARKAVINSSILDEPNNILAIEYLSCTSLKPIAVKRIGLGHDSGDGEYSASEIRKHLNKSETARLENCEKAVLYKLRNMNASDYIKITDVSEGLENRIALAVKKAKSLDELYELIKTKRYTHSRIRRIILRAFLGIDNEFPKAPLYLRILGFNENGKELLKEIEKNASLPVITKYADAQKHKGEILKAFEAESRFTDIHSLCYEEPRECGLEMTSKIIIK